MNFTSHIVPVKFYADLTEAQFNYLEKSEDIFYQVNGVGLFKGSTLIASVGSNVDLSYVDNQINNLRNQFNATVQSDGTVLLTIKGQNYTLATPSSVGNGGIEIIEPEDPQDNVVRVNGYPHTSFSNNVYGNYDKYGDESLFRYFSTAYSNIEPLVGGGQMATVNFTDNTGGYGQVYLFATVSEASNCYQKQGAPFKVQVNKFVYCEYSTVPEPQEEGVVVINNPYDVQTYMEDGGLIYDITSEEPEEVPNIYWAGNGEDLTIEIGTNSSVHAYMNYDNGKYEIEYESSNPNIVEVNYNDGTLVPKTLGSTRIKAKLIYLVDGHPVSAIERMVTVIAALPTFDIQGMGSVKYIEGQTWADWIENYPNIGQNSYIAPYFSVYNGYEVGYGMSAEELADYIAHGYITQEQYDEVYPLIVAGVKSTDLIQSKTYYFKFNTTGIESDENPVGEGQFAFTIGGERFIANEGMNLSQWIDSKYNTAGFVIKNNKAIVKVFENNNVAGDGGMYCAIMYGSSEFIGLDDVLKENDTFELLVYAPAYELDPNIRISSYRDEAYIGENFNVYWEANNINSSVLLYSSDTSVATISENRTVNAVGAGTATITVEGGGVSDSFTLTVKAADKGQSINNPYIMEDITDEADLDGYFRGVVDSITYSETYNNYSIVFEAVEGYNPIYAYTVALNEGIEAPTSGDTIIISGHAYAGKIKNAVIVLVEHPIQYNIALAEHSIELSVGETYHLGYNVSPEGAHVSFTTSDNEIISVDESGIIFGNLPGVAIVTARAQWEGLAEEYHDSVEVTVKELIPEEPEHGTTLEDPLTPEEAITLMNEANLRGQYLNDGATYYVESVVDHLLGNNVYLSQYLSFYATNPEEFGVGDTVLISGQLYAKVESNNYKIKNFIIISHSSPVVPQTYTITFKNYDDTILQVLNNVNAGETPVYTGETPTRPDSEGYTYTFMGWDPQIVAASSDAVYRAIFIETINEPEDPNAPVQVSTFNDLESAIQSGKNVVLTSRITTDESLAEVLNTDVEINLNNYKLECSKLMLTVSGENTITIKNGTIVTTEGVTLSAPNGNVVLDNVRAYDANGEINLAASSNSLHLKGDIWFRRGTPQSSTEDVGVKVANGTRVVIESEASVSVEEFIVTNDSFVADAEATITVDNFSTNAYVEVNGNYVNNNEISTLAQLQAAAANGGNYTLIADISGLSSSQRVNFVKNANLFLNGHSITSTYLGPCVLNGAYLSIYGDVEGSAINAVEGCAMAFDGSELYIGGGTYTCSDNFVFGTNGSSGRGNNNITIHDGIFNGNIVSAGYVACGVYVANNDNVSIYGGTFNITNGVGVLARSGNTTLEKTKRGPVFNVTGDGTLGKVGDSQVTVPSGQVLVLDLKANYPGGTPLISNGTDYSVYTIEA